MNIFRLSLRNISNRPLNSVLSVVLLALGVGIISLLLQVSRHFKEQMENNLQGIDMVIGAKGSPLQLILSAIYHIDSPTGNILLQDVKQIQKHPMVESGIPLSYGDSYSGYRIVGTDHSYPSLYEAHVSEGRLWQKPFEVTLGSLTAKKLNLSVGDSFVGVHGLMDNGEEHDEHSYYVVGIFNYTNSVLDQLILTSTESVWKVHNHDENDDAHHMENNHDHHSEKDDANHDDENSKNNDEILDREITAMLIKFRNPLGMVQLPRMVNEETNMQAAIPVYEISRLFDLMGIGIDMLGTLALIIIVVSGLSLFIGIYNALKDRRYEMALMRTYGASRWQLVWMVIQEGLILTLTGFILGIFLSRIGLWLVSSLIQTTHHYTFSGSLWVLEEGYLLASVIAIGLLAAVIPAVHVFRINISKTLVDA